MATDRVASCGSSSRPAGRATASRMVSVPPSAVGPLGFGPVGLGLPDVLDEPVPVAAGEWAVLGSEPSLAPAADLALRPWPCRPQHLLRRLPRHRRVRLRPPLPRALCCRLRLPSSSPYRRDGFPCRSSDPER